MVRTHENSVSTLDGDGWKIVVNTESIEVTSNGPRRDPGWRFIDAASHAHYVANGMWPTLTWEWDALEEDDDEDDDRTGHWECKQCEEVIVPGMLGPSGFREFIPGPTYVHIDLPDGRIVPVTDEEWAAARAAGTSIDSFVQSIIARDAARD